jgi:hypothetical protein
MNDSTNNAASAYTTEAAPVSSEPDGIEASAPPSLQAVDTGGVRESDGGQR